jgi:hypothetical protein
MAKDVECEQSNEVGVIDAFKHHPIADGLDTSRLVEIRVPRR